MKPRMRRDVVNPAAVSTEESSGEVSRGRFSWLLLCFTCSGMSGLIYELAWVRSLELIFGATTFAIATVLAAFMGGLAGGSYFIGRIGKKFGQWHPLRLYAAMEVIIAVLGVLVPLSFAALVPVYQEVWKTTHASFITFSALRFFLSALVLFIPTFMMGATLPIVSSYVNRQGSLGKGRIGLLYTCNTAGAGLGCLAAGLWLFPGIGLAKTQWLAVALNLIAAAGGWRLSRKPAQESAGADEPADVQNEAAAPSALEAAGPLIVAYAVSGFVAMLYEVAWSRVLVLVLGCTTYACTIMLATFLLGLTLGALGAARLRLRQPLLAMGICQFAIAVTTWLSVVLVEEIPWLYTKACETWHPVGSGLLLLQIVFAAGLMILPTLGLGAMFPITIQGLRTGRNNTAKVVGWAYAWNTMGAIAGSVLAGFFLVPVLGSQKTLLLGVVLNLCLSFLAMRFLKSATMPRWRAGFIVLLMLFSANVV